jgi:formate dehydrogenase subunit gamma
MTISTTTLADLVRAVAAEHGHERGPLLVMLHAIQERLGYVDPAVVPLLANELNLSRADVHGVVTFYRDFHASPQGRVTVRVCRAEACASVGAEELVKAVERGLGIAVGETTADGVTTLDQVFCLGNCALGPSAQINERVYGRVDADRALALARGGR